MKIETFEFRYKKDSSVLTIDSALSYTQQLVQRSLPQKHTAPFFLTFGSKGFELHQAYPEHGEGLAMVADVAQLEAKRGPHTIIMVAEGMATMFSPEEAKEIATDVEKAKVISATKVPVPSISFTAESLRGDMVYRVYAIDFIGEARSLGECFLEIDSRKVPEMGPPFKLYPAPNPSISPLN